MLLVFFWWGRRLRMSPLPVLTSGPLGLRALPCPEGRCMWSCPCRPLAPWWTLVLVVRSCASPAGCAVAAREGEAGGEAGRVLGPRLRGPLGSGTWERPPPTWPQGSMFSGWLCGPPHWWMVEQTKHLSYVAYCNFSSHEFSINFSYKF